MDKIKKYEKAILSILSDYVKLRYSNVDGENNLIVDKQNHRYLVMTIGRYKDGPDKGQLIHDSPMHFDIIDDKIWVQRNMTEWNVGEMLEKQGVPAADIVIGFLPDYMREYSESATA